MARSRGVPSFRRPQPSSDGGPGELHDWGEKFASEARRATTVFNCLRGGKLSEVAVRYKIQKVSGIEGLRANSIGCRMAQPM